VGSEGGGGGRDVEWGVGSRESAAIVRVGRVIAGVKVVLWKYPKK